VSDDDDVLIFQVHPSGDAVVVIYSHSESALSQDIVVNQRTRPSLLMIAFASSCKQSGPMTIPMVIRIFQRRTGLTSSCFRGTMTSWPRSALCDLSMLSERLLTVSA
jgi:predicted membrane-bound dolichyl-phosphate-mannose-protein mannosyltransferase